MRFWYLLLLVAASPLFAQSYAGQDLANLREDVRLLSQRVGELTLKVEQLERENSQLQRKADAGNVSYVTLSQLNDAIAELNKTLRANVANSKSETLQIVATQMEKLANQMNAALESISRGSTVRTVAATAASTVAAATTGTPANNAASTGDTSSKEGTYYTVVKGDNMAKIAAKTNARAADIIAANKISDPSKIQAGQVLFIPGGK